MRRRLPVVLALLLVLCSGVPERSAAAGPTDPEPSSLEPDPPDPEPPDPERLEWLVWPVLASNADMGILLGLQLVVARFHEGVTPYAVRSHLRGSVSLKEGPDGLETPVHMDFVVVDLPGLLDNRLRLFLGARYDQINNAGYFGLGNAAPHGTAAGSGVGASTRRYRYRRRAPGLWLHGRLALREQLFLLGGLRGLYVMSDPDAGSRLDQDREQLCGLADHAALQLSFGLVRDTRNHETAPYAGSYLEASVRTSPGLGTDLHFGGLWLDGRYFRSLYQEYLVLAVRGMADLLVGNVPFYELARAGTLESIGFLGGRRGLPGFPEGRYHGPIKVGGILELRSMFYALELWTRLRLGAVLFADLGRVWASWSENRDLDGSGVGLKGGVGAGLRLQIGETVMLRADVAWSADAADAGVPIAFYFDAYNLF